jgi:hypothetical protein
VRSRPESGPDQGRYPTFDGYPCHQQVTGQSDGTVVPVVPARWEPWNGGVTGPRAFSESELRGLFHAMSYRPGLHRAAKSKVRTPGPGHPGDA